MAGEIIKTIIGTPTSTGNLSLCSGNPLWPPFPVIPLGFQYKSSGLTLVRDFNLIFARVSLGGALGATFGMCGPSYAIKFDAEGHMSPYDGNRHELTLEIEHDETMAGAWLGLGVNASVFLEAKIWTLHWAGWWPYGAWDTKLEVKLDVGIDVFKAAIDIILYICKIKNMVGKAVVEGAKDTPLAWVGESSDQYKAGNGVIRTDIDVSVPINCWSILVLAAHGGSAIPWVNVAAGVIIGIHHVLEATLSSIGFGPTVGIRVPVTLEIKDVTVDNVKFERTNTTGGKWVGIQTGYPPLPIPDPPKNISFNMAHRTEMHVTIGLYVELQIIEFIHLGSSVKVDVNDLFGWKGDLTSPYYYHTLKSAIGRTQMDCQNGCSQLARNAGMVDVEFK
jgi:hypothetical protein